MIRKGRQEAGFVDRNLVLAPKILAMLALTAVNVFYSSARIFTFVHKDPLQSFILVSFGNIDLSFAN